METVNQPGQSLRQAREAAGLNVADVVHRTKFPRTVVEALERDDYTVFSSPTYAKSYLSQYAGFLGIDSAKWLDFFEPAAFAAPQDMLSMIESPVHPEHRPTVHAGRSGSGGLLPTMLLIALSIALIYGAVHGYAYFEQRFGEPITLKALNPAPQANPTPSNPALPSADTATSTRTISQPLPEASPPPRATIVEE